MSRPQGQIYNFNMKFSFTFLCLLILSTAHSLQAQLNDAGDEVPSVHHELTFGTGVHTRGFNYVSIQYGQIHKLQRTLFFNLDLVELKSPRERRKKFEILSATGTGSSTSFIYGKRNNLYALRLGAGEKIYISEKKNTTGVALAFGFSGGVTFGVLKPYKLDLIYRDLSSSEPSVTVRSETYSEANHDKFLSFADIQGASGFAEGWDDIDVVPGLFVKATLLLDWRAFNQFAQSIELGLSADVYSRKMPIMIGAINSPVFINLYANINLGKRW